MYAVISALESVPSNPVWSLFFVKDINPVNTSPMSKNNKVSRPHPKMMSENWDKVEVNLISSPLGGMGWMSFKALSLWKSCKLEEKN